MRCIADFGQSGWQDCWSISIEMVKNKITWKTNGSAIEIWIIISNKENNICYTIPVFEKLYGIGELNNTVKTKLLNKEKEFKKKHFIPDIEDNTELSGKAFHGTSKKKHLVKWIIKI